MSSNSFSYDIKSFNVAKAAASKFDKEKDALKYLYESKPPFLQIRDSWLGLDKQTLEKEIKGLSDKLKIHGYSDRGERLQYLHFVLTKKLVEKEDYFKTAMKFILEMSERPTAVVRFDVSEDKYSLHPDEDMTDEDDSEKQKSLLRQILYDGEEAIVDLDPVSYSSDSELSDWTSEEDESEKSKKSTNEIVKPDKNLKPSRSFSEFSDLPITKDYEDKKREMELYWTMEGIRAQNFVSDLRKVEIVLLQSQPVISGLLTLQSKFGEYWEWKKRTSSDGNVNHRLQIISENDVIREVVWQFSALNPTSSPVFANDWKLKPGLMVSTLSVSSFAALMRVYEVMFASLTKFKKFVNSIENRSTTNEPPPKMFRTYAQGLAEIMIRVEKDVGIIEKNLKTANDRCIEDRQPCTTLIQLGRQLQHFKEIIALLDRIHTISIVQPTEMECNSSDQWFYSIRLMYCLAMHLSLQSQPIPFGILLFLFCKCLHAFLDEINLAINTLTWNEDQFLFVRDKNVKLSDSNFWTDAITLRPFECKLEEIGVPVIKSFMKIIPGLLIAFKTSEMLSQLEEDFQKILGEPPCSRKIVDDFLENLLPPWNIDEKTKLEQTFLPDYKTHFKFIGLEGSFVADSVKYILEQQKQSSTRQSQNMTKFDRFLSLSEVPTENIWEILESVLLRYYTPHCDRAKNCIHKIFQDYQVDESMKMFREIVLGVREDFAKEIIDLSSRSTESNRYRYEDEMNRNPRFQKLLNDCYPEGRDNFDIEFKLDRSSDMNHTFVVKPHFPLNLILTSQSVDGYLFVSRQLHRIRKSLWELTSLNINECKVVDDVEPNRPLLFRFALIHFCSNIRAYLVFKIFAKNLSVSSTTQAYDLDDIRKVHEDYLQEIETKILRSQVMDHVIIRKMVSMSEVVSKCWESGIPSKSMVLLEDTLKKCWNVVKTFHRTNFSTDFNELSFYFGPPPSYL